jgi:hypothetical protein
MQHETVALKECASAQQEFTTPQKKHALHRVLDAGRVNAHSTA